MRCWPSRVRRQHLRGGEHPKDRSIKIPSPIDLNQRPSIWPRSWSPGRKKPPPSQGSQRGCTRELERPRRKAGVDVSVAVQIMGRHKEATLFMRLHPRAHCNGHTPRTLAELFVSGGTKMRKIKQEGSIRASMSRSRAPMPRSRLLGIHPRLRASTLARNLGSTSGRPRGRR